jgi:hypothetical protein
MAHHALGLGFGKAGQLAGFQLNAIGWQLDGFDACPSRGRGCGGSEDRQHKPEGAKFHVDPFQMAVTLTDSTTLRM